MATSFKMTLWALSDPHLSFGVPNKKMDIFGKKWEAHAEKIQNNWVEVVREEDLVLIPGDISWAMNREEVLPDLQWLARLPGTKVMIKGNHDYWWHSLSQVKALLPSSVHAIQNNAFHWKGVTIGGARLWDSSEYAFHEVTEYHPSDAISKQVEREDQEKIFQRELHRLELSLKELDPNAHTCIALTHYPPIGLDLKPSRVSNLLEKYQVDICLFGHLHSLKQGVAPFGRAQGIQFLLTSCDYLEFKPIRILG